VEQAIALTGRTADEIRHSILSAKLHTSTRGKVMRICLRSLLECVSVLKSFRDTEAS
jgi:hypothetical protein